MAKIDEIKMLRLGQRDENLARSLTFDCSDWLEQYPEASIHILFRRPGESAIVPMSTTLEGTTLTWLVHDFEVGKTGVGNAEFRAVDTAGLRRKSRIIPCSIEETLLGDDETVLYTQDQVDETLAHISEAAQAAQAAQASEEAAALSAQEAGESATSASAAASVATSARDAAQAAQTAAETAQHQAEAAQSGVHADAEAAEQAKVAAQAAQAGAQGAASQASADRTAAESARADAEAAAEHAEEVVGGIDQAGADQVVAVNAAGQAQVAAVNAAGTTQVGNVNTAGTTQVNAVQAKGTQVIASIPADYSALSDDVSDLKSAINEFEPFFKVDKNALVLGEYINNSGVVKTDGGTDYGLTDYLNITGIKTIKFYTALRYCKAAFYDKTKTLISLIESAYGQYGGEYTIESSNIPENAVYIRVSCNNQSYATGSFDKFYVLLCRTINDVGEEINKLQGGIDGLQESMLDPLNGKTDYVTENMTTFIRQDLDSNLVANGDIIEGSWINTVDGKFETNQYTSRYSRTGYVDVVAGQSYTWMIDNKPYSYCVFDATKTPITGYYGRTPNNYNCVSIPQNGKYLAFSWQDRIGQEDYAVMIKGTTPIAEYEPSYDKLVKDPYATVKYVKSLIPESSGHPTLELPKQFEIVVGDTFQMFWKGVINAVDYMNYYPEVVCDIGKSYTRFFWYTGAQADIGTHTMTVKLFDNSQNLLDEKTVNLVVKAKATSPASKKVVLYVTDSLGNNGYVPDEFNRRLVGTGGTPSGDGLTNITFIGTNSSTNRGIKYVGNGGWSWASYNTSMSTNKYMWITANNHGKTSEDQHSIYTDTNNVEWQIETIETNRIKIARISASGTLPTTGTLTWKDGGVNHSNIVYTASEQAAGNPFWSQTQNKVSFSEFVTGQGESSLDFVYVLLGWNTTGATETALKTYIRTFLNNVLADYPSCKIVILGIEIPSRDGLAMNYGQNYGVLSSYRQSMNHVFNLNKWYAEVAEETAYVGKVSFVNVAGQFDTEYNMQASTITVNLRNQETLPFQMNGVHPAESGYYQIADACYRDFVHKLQE